MEVVTIEDLKFHYFKPFRHVIVFRGLIQTEINFSFSKEYGRLGRWTQMEVLILTGTSLNDPIALKRRNLVLSILNL